MKIIIKIRAFFWKLRLKFDKDTSFIDEMKLKGRARRAAILWRVKNATDLTNLAESTLKQRQARGINKIGNRTMEILKIMCGVPSKPLPAPAVDPGHEIKKDVPSGPRRGPMTALPPPESPRPAATPQARQAGE